MNDNDYEMQVEDPIKAEEIKYENRIGSEITYLFTANLSIILFSLDILKCLETPILWNEMY